MDSRLHAFLGDLETACKSGSYQRFLELLDRHYVHASASARNNLRSCVTRDEASESAFLEQLREISQQAEVAKDYPASLRACLLSVSLCSRYDSRDMLMSLAATWRWAEKQGIDPLPFYREFAAVSDSDQEYLVGGSTQGMILRIAEDAPYRAQLLK